MAIGRSVNDLVAFDGSLRPSPSSSPTPLSEPATLESREPNPRPITAPLSEPTSLESREPNPRPTKTMRTDSSDPPPPEAEVVVDEAPNPTLIVEDESKKKPTPTDSDDCLFFEISDEEENSTSDWGSKLKKMEDDDSSDDDWSTIIGTKWEKVFLDPEDRNIVKDDGTNFANVGDDCPADAVKRVIKFLPTSPKQCDICGSEGDHWHTCCPFLEKFPPGGELFNKKDYIVCCCCGIIADDGSCCNPYCVPFMTKRVIPKTALYRFAKERLQKAEGTECCV